MAEFFFHRLLVEPLVTVVASGRDELWPAIVHTSRVAGGRPASVLIAPSWHLPKHLPRIREAIADAARQFPGMRFTILAATAEEVEIARAAEIDAFLCNQNAFLDERLIYPEPNVPRLYDAVYNARLVPFKRHELAAATPRLALVTGAYGVEADYARATIAGLRDLAWSNYRPVTGLVSHLDVEGVRRVLVQSHVGLALSAAEGAMYAAAEYLLAGLPVVTTPSIGGRDLFFHTDYVITVAETPEAVAAAVADLKARALDPYDIRRRTIALFEDHRRRLVERLSAIAGADLMRLADPLLWLPQFKHQLRTRLKTRD